MRSRPQGWAAGFAGGLIREVYAPIELQITGITTDDMVDAFVVRDRHLQTPLRRWGLRLGFFVAVLAAGYVAQVLVGSSGLDLIDAGVVVFAAAVVLVVLRPRRLYRIASRRLVRDNADLFGPATVTVTDAGLQRRAATGQATVNWEHYARYAETSASFVLFLSDRPAAAVECLPKRALTGADDVDRLRAVLDRHLERVTRRTDPSGSARPESVR